MDDMRLARHAINPWFMVFEDRGNNVWWHHFLRAGFKHCWAFGYELASKRWVRFEVVFEGCDIRTMTHAEVDQIVAEAAETGSRILECQVDGTTRPRLRPIASCVSAMCHLVNLPDSALTPYGLYRKLLAAGAKSAFELPGI